MHDYGFRITEDTLMYANNSPSPYSALATMEHLKDIVYEQMPAGVGVAFVVNESKNVPPGTIMITITRPSIRKPWWRFWK